MREDREERKRKRLAEFQSGPASPCISVCQMNPTTNLCIGCWRTIDEIREWSISNAAERYAILAKIAERKSMVSE